VMALTNKNSLKFILIDDSRNDLDVVSEALETFDFIQVKNFTDTQLAYNYLQEVNTNDNQNLILLDLNMPKKNGFELLKEIKANSKLSHIPILIYTSSKRPEDINRAYSLGASSYIIKPITIDDVERTFRDIVHYWTNVSLI